MKQCLICNKNLLCYQKKFCSMKCFNEYKKKYDLNKEFNKKSLNTMSKSRSRITTGVVPDDSHGSMNWKHINWKTKGE